MRRRRPTSAGATTTNSDALRARIGEPRREAYGPGEFEKLDIYRAKQSNAPIFVYIHGGAWLAGTSRASGYPAEMFLNAGAHYVALDFVQIKEAGGDLGMMADQVRRGIAWVYKNAKSFDGDTEPPLHRRLLVRRASVRRRAGHRLAEGLRPARRHRSAAGCA